jgi:alpha-galactosidase
VSAQYVITLSKFQFSDMQVEYLLATESQMVGLRLYPVSMIGELATRRDFLQTHEVRLLPAFMPPLRAWEVESLVQFKLTGDAVDGYGQGLTLRNSDSLSTLRYAGQEVLAQEGKTEVVTTLRSSRGYACEHHLLFRGGDEAFTFYTVFRNESREPFSLEMLSSFSLGGLTPFAADDAPHRLHLHRFRSYWSAEGRHTDQSVEELHLERSWSTHSVRTERFGQVGSMPVRGYFPFVAVEDRPAGVLWGAQLAWAGSWQMEAYRRDDELSLSGGLADREFGHWLKSVAPSEEFVSPLAYVSTVRGDLDDLCQRLTAMQLPATEQAPASEQCLPVLANEWCTTWGNPQHDRVVALAERLKNSGVKYFVIDSGWYQDDRGDWDTTQGEWLPNQDLFPNGLAATAAAIRERGMIPGLWFEFEVVGSQSPLFSSQTDHFLKRDGIPVTVRQRHFWDFRDPWVSEYLREKVIDRLRDSGLGYIKVDYNETIGLGVDGAESLGEGMRQHLLGVQEFFRQMRRELPDLVIEVCASGGHRLEPSMLALSSMGSFSDAHETLDIPIIAANLHRLILPRQSQIWAVLHAADSMQRLAYSLVAGFLGRLCLSGEIDQLSDTQWALVQEAIRFYEQIAPIIKRGRSRLYQPIGAAWRHPQGAQAVLRVAASGDHALVVAHTFAAPLPSEITVPLPAGDWQIVGVFPGTVASPEIVANRLPIRPSGEFTGWALHLARQ